MFAQEINPILFQL